MRWLKISGTLVFVALLLFLIVITFSAVESRFQCSGEISSSGSVQAATVYLKREKYRWWVGLWSDSAAAVWVEVPNKALEYYGHTQEVGDQLQLFDSTKRLRGNLSTLSNSLAIDIPVAGFFDGTCKRVEQ